MVSFRFRPSHPDESSGPSGPVNRRRPLVVLVVELELEFEVDVEVEFDDSRNMSLAISRP
jgi:hypothetical protein